MAYQQHQEASRSIVARCAVVTLSDTRSEPNDATGHAIQRMVRDAGHSIAEYRLIPDEPPVFREVMESWLGRPAIDVILSNGGTGMSGRDQTIDVVQTLLDTELPGFGELFRMLSWEQIGSGAMLSRAIGGVARAKLVFAMPGSTAAAELAMGRLIIPELRHLLGELRKEENHLPDKFQCRKDS